MQVSRSKEPIKPMPKARTRLKPKKKKTTSARKKIPKGIRNLSLSAMQRLRRLEEANDEGYVRCISCGKVMKWTEAQGGHYISRTCRAVELDKDNIWPQCPQCNGVRGGNPIPYRYNLAKKIGEERVRRLEDMRAAYYGDNEAFQRLSAADQVSVIGKKGKLYYAEVYKELKEELSKAESRQSHNF